MDAKEIDLQTLGRGLVDREVVANVSDWVDFAIAVDGSTGYLPAPAVQDHIRDACPIDVDEIPATAECQSCGGGGDPGSCNECEDGRVYIDIYEWWLVTQWLGGKLEELGEVVLEGQYWGRQCPGQAIFLDDVIQTIAVARATS